VVYQRNGVNGPKAADKGMGTRISRFTHVESGAKSFARLSSELVLWRANVGYPEAQDGFTYPVRSVCCVQSRKLETAWVS
jgi:hypothetical protein